MGKRRRNAGFTLVELMVVLAILGVLLAVAAPAFSGVVNSMRLTTAANALFSSLLLARSEAIKRNSRSVVCKSATGLACASIGSWEQGWIVFHDANNNAALDVGEAVISREQGVPASIRMTGNSPVANYVSYTSVGSASYTSGAFQAGTFTACVQSAGATEARQIVINISGRPRAVRTTVAKCPL